jgi:beta-glucosidase-like glycosyl hydrolase
MTQLMENYQLDAMDDLRRRIAGLIMPRADARSWHDPTYRDAIHRLIDMGVGGIGIFLGTLDDTARMIEDMRSRGGRRLLMAADYEHGLPMRLEGGVAFPRAMALGRTLPGITEHIAAAIAEEARALGVHWNFAPVCDVNANPDNPIINTRSFGEDAQTVAAHAAAYVTGTQLQRVMACAKHVPGHGDTAVDSHVALPTITIARELAEQREFIPFRAAIDAGVKSVMIGHIVVPFIDADLPASLSPSVVRGLVRDAWGFHGLVTTDALDMRAITDRYAPAEAAVLAYMAGNDVLLLPEDPLAAIDGVYRAIESGRCSDEHLGMAERRWEEARAFVRTTPDDARRPPVDLSAHAHMALRAADAAIRIDGDASIMPLTGERPFAAFAVIDEADADAATTWCNYLAQATEGNSDFAFIDGTIDDEDLTAMAEGVADAAVLLFAFFGKAVAYRGSIPGLDRIPEIMQRLAAGRPTIVVACGSPYGIERLPATMRMYAYSETMPSLAATVMRLIGRPAGG